LIRTAKINRIDKKYACSFSILNSDRDGKGPRVGMLQTPHGSFETPCFLPVASFGDLRAISFEEAKNCGTQIIMVNGWHVYHQAGAEKLHKAGGVHNFINWPRSIFTDSGGYQIFSLRDTSKISDEGVVFDSYSGGDFNLLTPEYIIEVQRHIGSDIMTALDECAPYPCSKKHAEGAMLRTNLWASKSIDAFNQSNSCYAYEQDLWGIIQGGVYKDLRKKSVETLTQMEFGGYGIGGLSIGMPRTAMRDMTSLVCELLPSDKPRHLLGAGLPQNILDGIEDGADMFDCVLPIRKAQRGVAFTKSGIVRYKNSQQSSLADMPLDTECDCFVCKTYSREQLRRFYRTEKDFAARLSAIHNLYFYHKITEGARKAIREGTFAAYKSSFSSAYEISNKNQ